MTRKEAYRLVNSFWALGFGAMVLAPVSFRKWVDWSVWAFGQASPLDFDQALDWANRIWRSQIRGMS